MNNKLASLVLLLLLWSVASLSLAASEFWQLTISGPVAEREQFFQLFDPQAHSIKELLTIFKQAEENTQLKGIILKIGIPEMGFAKIQQLHRAMKRLRAKGRLVICYLKMPLLPAYLLAMEADQVVMPPTSPLLIFGMRIDVYYLRSLLDKLGIQLEFVSAGKYKSLSYEALVRDEMSSEAQRIFSELLDDYYLQVVEQIAAGRNLSPRQVRELMDRGPFTAQEALNFKLVDKIAYEDEIVNELQRAHTDFQLQEAEVRREWKPTGLFDFFKMLPPAREGEQAAGNKIAVIYATGTILPGSQHNYPLSINVITDQEYSEYLQECRQRTDIAAVILRIDSPGGSGIAADALWNEIQLTRERKPVVISVSDVAASGGYYLTMGGDYVFAEEGSLIGAIGVFAGKLVLADLFDKLGIHKRSLWRGEHARMLSEGSRLSPSERQALQRLLDDFYGQFVAKAAKGRKLSPQELEEKIGARIMSGRNALKLGLIDSLGGVNQAIDKCRELAHVPPERSLELVSFPPTPTFWEFIERLFGSSLTTQTLRVPAPKLLENYYLQAYLLLNGLHRHQLMAFLPLFIEFQ